MKNRLIKFLILSLIFIFVITIFTGCGSNSKKINTNEESNGNTSQKPEYVFKLGHVENEDSTWHKAFLKFAEEVNKKSNGRIEIKIYPNSQLGSEREMIEGVQAGTMDMTMSGETLQNWAPKVGVMSALYAIRDYDQLDKVAGGEIGKEIEKEILEKTHLRPIAWFARGPRYLTSNRPIKTPDDLKGLRVRVPNVPLFVKSWEALGAKPVPMALSEVFTALQQGTVEAQENPLALIKSNGFYEVQKYVNKTEHVIGWIYILIGEKQFEALPNDLQKVILDAAKDMQQYERQLFMENEKNLAKELQDKGMEFIDVDKEAFKAKVTNTVIASLTPEQKDLYMKIINTK
ncbi:TRAP transporter substrate-binding protein [Thermoanaerobacterium sp. DL9XJH110]|uniref:TRAP transporter substrate-binding protein n=1 Tax=Thermoanaerobacterium sp. DL9XJH110 TaxID=3386643 RepID=UPI003BB5677D